MEEKENEENFPKNDEAPPVLMESNKINNFRYNNINLNNNVNNINLNASNFNLLLNKCLATHLSIYTPL